MNLQFSDLVERVRDDGPISHLELPFGQQNRRASLAKRARMGLDGANGKVRRMYGWSMSMMDQMPWSRRQAQSGLRCLPRRAGRLASDTLDRISGRRPVGTAERLAMLPREAGRRGGEMLGHQLEEVGQDLSHSLERAGDWISAAPDALMLGAKLMLFRKLVADSELLKRAHDTVSCIDPDARRRNRILTGAGWIAAAGIGAGAMYLLDPQWGFHRRTRVRDGLVYLQQRAGTAIDSMRTPGEPGEPELARRVRASFHRMVSSPERLEVTTDQGHVTLSGPILAHEVDPLLAYVATIPGVTGIENRLEIHDRPEDMPAQPATGWTGNGFGMSEEQRWTPTAGLVALAAGGMLAATGVWWFVARGKG